MCIRDRVYRAKTGHIGGDFSVMEILVSLYLKEMNISPENQDDPDRDYFVMSKGHSVEEMCIRDRSDCPQWDIQQKSSYI